jgi:hypothetical protein
VAGLIGFALATRFFLKGFKKMAKEETSVTVKFEKNYVAPRGLPIAGRKGDECELPVCEQVTQLLNDGVFSAVKKGAGKRKTATKSADEVS